MSTHSGSQDALESQKQDSLKREPDRADSAASTHLQGSSSVHVGTDNDDQNSLIERRIVSFQKMSTRRVYAFCTALMVGVISAASMLITNSPIQRSAIIGENSPRESAEDQVLVSASSGSCLTLAVVRSGEEGLFAVVDCHQPHLFEVTNVIDLKRYSEQRFGSAAKFPTDDQWRELRDEICVSHANTYLPNGLDPAGRFKANLMKPGKSGWKRGSRTVLCGIDVKPGSASSTTLGRPVKDMTQELEWHPGTCLSMKNPKVLTFQIVVCKKAHTIEVVSSIDMKKKFGDKQPSRDQATQFLNDKCYQAASNYLGSETALRDSTLIPILLPGVLGKESWNAGTREVSCGLAHVKDNGQPSVLKGAARRQFTINDKPPVKPAPLPPDNGGQLPDLSDDPLIPGGVPGGID